MQKVFRALASGPRLEILKHIAGDDGFVCLCEIDAVPDRDRSVVYRHFKKLEEAGLLETRKDGRRVEGRVRNLEKVKELLKIAKEVSEDED